ncbi:ADP-ribosylation factor family-domain-containing protein [Protomyces lactucae-debilis]|uniref:Abnormal eversion of vulva protein 20 n=1 Tax=Protomyces lactucae-debilis TaxID=2754530 RepID=A0A1Y2FNY5_PROLT|nr:ADP-ribosylation factor family-domain-containing protein [Protomyces lactucae-debilis]ORY84926.1 ADP-ribosylation factor family-domain-containing protein [Protomyces lactucae-debilis]
MGLLTIIRKQKLRDNALRILILGLDNAGKTTLLTSLLGEDISQISPTLGFSIRTVQFGGFKLDIWDVGGQKTLRSYWRNYFESTDGLIWVVDATDHDRMQDSREELHALLTEERLLGADLLVLANKTDILGCMTSAQIEQALLLGAIRGHRWRIFEVSAYTGKNVKEGFEYLVSNASQRIL